VHLVFYGCWTARARGYNTGIETCMGKTVVFEIGAVRVLIAERSAITVDPELFRSHGVAGVLQNCGRQIAQRLSRAYEPIATRIILVDTPGVSTGPPPTSHASRAEATEGERCSVAHQFRRLLGDQHGVG
jgi:microcystin degradation protein MlrC